MENLAKAIFEHYEKYLGEMLGADNYPKENIQLMGYQDAVEGCLTFATMGMNLQEKNLGSCCEVVLTTDKDYDGCASMLMAALSFIIANQIPVGPGLAINGLSPAFQMDHNKSAIYFTEATMFTPAFRKIGETCTVYMAFFLTAQEELYLKTHGRARFEAILEEKKADIIDLDRKSVC